MNRDVNAARNMALQAVHQFAVGGRGERGDSRRVSLRPPRRPVAVDAAAAGPV